MTLDFPRRLVLEGIVIVASILLAFAIDAGWDAWGDRQRARQLQISITSDVRATQAAIEYRREWAEDVVRQARAILEGIARGERGEALDALVFTVGNVFVKGRWAPINFTYEQALGSGDLALIDDAELRSLLGQYTAGLDNLTGLQHSVNTQYYGQLEPFLVAHTDYAQVAWDAKEAGLVGGIFQTQTEDLASMREFANLLNLKLELELELIDGLDAAESVSKSLFEKLITD